MTAWRIKPGSEPASERALRDPRKVMKLARLGSFHQSRLSFMRILTRRMQREGWQFSRPVFDVDAQGVGHAIYAAHTGQRTYSLVAFAHDLPADKRSDRVIAEAWDCTFTLFDGVPSAADIERLRANIPLQEAGRVTQSELSVSRANRSVRLWEYMVSCLADGRQPDAEEVAKVGYLMRTTAVYGSGKLGAADRETISDRRECSAPFQIEMLSVYLTRTFVRDLMQHMANTRGGEQAVQLDPHIARSLGIGNSTGLGMAPFILNHPQLFHNWIAAREEAIARVRRLPKADAHAVTVFRDVLARARHSVQLWRSDHPHQRVKCNELKSDLALVSRYIEADGWLQDAPWDGLMVWAEERLGLEAQEAVASLILEPYGSVVDDLAHQMSDDVGATQRINGAMTVEQLRAQVAQNYDWALAIDWASPESTARVWYVSAEKSEPRLGERFEEAVADYEQPLAPGRDAAALYSALEAWEGAEQVAAFLLAHPEHRHMVRRLQITSQAPYAEIRDNTIGADLMPIDMLRCKLSFFGAVHFDPRSDRWVRICMFGNAPYPEDLNETTADFWPYPVGVSAPIS